MLSLCDMTLTELFSPIVSILPRLHTVNMHTRATYGLCFCLEGEITYTQNGRKCISEPNTVVLLPKGGGYTLSVDKGGRFPLINFLCDGFFSSQIDALPLPCPDPIVREVEELSRLFLVGASRAARFSLFYSLIDRITDCARAENRPLFPVMRYIEDHLGDPSLDNSRLARELGVSEVYFRRLFAQATGASPRQYLLRLRMEKAKRLLCETPLTVGEIASRVGFGSVYHFCRTFRERTGQTPTEYAAANRRYEL